VALTFTTSKQCRLCNEVKPLEAFTVWSRSKDGHTARCRACVNAANKRRYMNRSQHYREKLRGFNKRLKDEKADCKIVPPKGVVNAPVLCLNASPSHAEERP